MKELQSLNMSFASILPFLVVYRRSRVVMYEGILQFPWTEIIGMQDHEGNKSRCLRYLSARITFKVQ